MPKERKISPIVEMDVDCCLVKASLPEAVGGDGSFCVPPLSGKMKNVEIKWEEGNVANHKEPDCS